MLTNDVYDVYDTRTCGTDLDEVPTLGAWTNDDAFTLYSHVDRNIYNDDCSKLTITCMNRTRCNTARHFYLIGFHVHDTMMMHAHCIHTYEGTYTTMLVMYNELTRVNHTQCNIAWQDDRTKKNSNDPFLLSASIPGTGLESVNKELNEVWSSHNRDRPWIVFPTTKLSYMHTFNSTHTPKKTPTKTMRWKIPENLWRNSKKTKKTQNPDLK